MASSIIRQHKKNPYFYQDLNQCSHRVLRALFLFCIKPGHLRTYRLLRTWLAFLAVVVLTATCPSNITLSSLTFTIKATAMTIIWEQVKPVIQFRQNIFILYVWILNSCKWVHTEPDSFGSNPLVIRRESTADPSSWLKGMRARNSFVCACLLPTNLNCSYTNSASTGLCISKLSINRYCITFLPYLSFAQRGDGQRVQEQSLHFIVFILRVFLSVLCVKFHGSSSFFP